MRSPSHPAVPRSIALPLFGRAVVLWGLVHLATSFAAVVVDVDESGGGVHPAGVVILTSLLAWIDLRRRGELLLWTNLGLPIAGLVSAFTVIAVSCELLLAILRG